LEHTTARIVVIWNTPRLENMIVSGDLEHATARKHDSGDLENMTMVIWNTPWL
jgi:hypothetical protein